MTSVRSWLVVAIPLIALFAMAATEVRRSTIPSSDWHDLAISGRGYIHTVDENGENPIWLRYARLAINPHGLLCANVDGNLRPLEPAISIPSDWERIDIDTVGRVTVNTSGSAGLSIGSIHLTTFSAEVLGDPTSTTNEDNQFGPPTTDEPGRSGAGFLVQRSSLEYVIPLTRRTIVALSFAAIWFSGGLWYNQKYNKP